MRQFTRRQFIHSGLGPATVQPIVCASTRQQDRPTEGGNEGLTVLYGGGFVNFHDCSAY